MKIRLGTLRNLIVEAMGASFPRVASGPDPNPAPDFVEANFPGAIAALQALRDAYADDEDVEILSPVIDDDGYLVEENGPLYWDGEEWTELGPTE
jgi:hypothetical protein